MANLETIQASYGRNICRDCINRAYGTKLRPGDCLYEVYPGQCMCCGEMRAIVIGLRLSGRLKLLFRTD